MDARAPVRVRVVPVRVRPINRHPHRAKKNPSAGANVAIIGGLTAAGAGVGILVWYLTSKTTPPPSCPSPDMPLTASGVCPSNYYPDPNSTGCCAPCQDTSPCSQYCPNGTCPSGTCASGVCPGGGQGCSLVLAASPVTVPANGGTTLSVTGAFNNPSISFYYVASGSITAVLIGSQTASNDGYAQVSWAPAAAGTYTVYATGPSPCTQSNSVTVTATCTTGLCPPGCPCPSGQDCENGTCVCPTGYCGANCPCPANYACTTAGTCECENCANCACPSGFFCVIAPGAIPASGTCVPDCTPGECSANCPCASGQTCSGGTCICAAGGSCVGGCS